MRFISVFLAICAASCRSIDGEEIRLADGTSIDIRDPAAYLYLDDTTNSTILRSYLLLEVHPKVALLCPRNYSISQINQKLIINKTTSTEMLNLTTEMPTEPGFPLKVFEGGNKDSNEAPCPTIFKCIGFQACLFKFSNEFCHRDPAPYVRKMLYVNVYCRRDYMLQKNTKRDLVLHMRYYSKLEDATFKGNKDYASTMIIEDTIPEEEVFTTGCPNVKEAVIDKGYRGECNNDPIDGKDFIQQTWTLFGRTQSHECRHELFQVFCAYQYNADGLCAPPLFFNMKNQSTQYNFKSLPRIGHRPPIAEEQGYHIRDDIRPVTIGFLLLLHANVKSAVQLLKSMWQPSHFYVIHVDKKATVFKKELIKAISDAEESFSNVVILPDDRSFVTAWASYEILRAQLEAMEELLRMGNWDFVINLSGSDMLLRSIDNLAASLAPYRGLNFLPWAELQNSYTEETNSTNPIIDEQFHSCDSYVYNVTKRAVMPELEDFQIFNAPQWGVFSRNFIEYLVDETKRSPKINKYQFYLQTHLLPDESYISTVLMNSEFNDTLHRYPVHSFKRFTADNADSLCRHSTEADFCGQGPTIFNEDDTTELMTLSHHSFFARKFHSDVDDVARRFTLGLAESGYDAFIKTFLHPELLMTLAENALSYLSSINPTVLHHQLSLLFVLKVQLLPSLIAHDPSCRLNELCGVTKITDHRMWLDLAFIDENDPNSVKFSRISMRPVVNGRFCYSCGDLKMIFISPWTKDEHKNESDATDEMTNQDVDKQSNFIGLTETLPLPFGPAGTKSLSIGLFFVLDNANESCIDDSETEEYEWEITVGDIYSTISVTVVLVSPTGVTQHFNESITLSKNDTDDEPHEQIIFHSHTFTINCGEMEPGPWIMRLMQVDTILKPKIYSVPFYILDYENSDAFQHQADDMQHLWSIENIDFLQGADLPSEYLKIIANYDYDDKEESGTANGYGGVRVSKSGVLQAPRKIKGEKYKRSIQEFVITIFTCYGGVLILVSVSLILRYRLHVARNVLLPQKHLLYAILILGGTMLIQAILLLTFC